MPVIVPASGNNTIENNVAVPDPYVPVSDNPSALVFPDPAEFPVVARPPVIRFALVDARSGTRYEPFPTVNPVVATVDDDPINNPFVVPVCESWTSVRVVWVCCSPLLDHS